MQRFFQLHSRRSPFVLARFNELLLYHGFHGFLDRCSRCWRSTVWPVRTWSWSGLNCAAVLYITNFACLPIRHGAMFRHLLAYRPLAFDKWSSFRVSNEPFISSSGWPDVTCVGASVANCFTYELSDVRLPCGESLVQAPYSWQDT